VPDSVNIHSIDSLEELRGALIQLRDDTYTSFRLFEREIRTTTEWFTERRNHWERQIKRRILELREAEASLERCRRAGDSDNPRDCRLFEERVREAHRSLIVAQEELRTVQQWTQKFKEQLSSYERRMQSVSTHLTEQVPAATTALTRLIESLDAYTGRSTARAVSPTSNLLLTVGDTPTESTTSDDLIPDIREPAKPTPANDGGELRPINE